MQKFSEAYAKARDVLANQSFESAWDKLFKSGPFKELMDEEGPAASQARVLDHLRNELAKDTKHGKLLASMLGGGVADAIMAAATNKTSPGSLAERAAAIKFLKHLYLTRVSGGQQLWCYAGPKAYSEWVFDEVKGNDSTIKSRLAAENEVYGISDRKAMCDALSLALAWCQKGAAALGTAGAKQKQLIRDWFADANTTDAQLEEARTTLAAGLLKIAGVCNSGRLIFSDHAPDRAKGGWRDWAFVYKSEKMDVVYMQGAALKAAHSASKQWMCALTIIHELTHREMATDDHRYDFDGLAPGPNLPFDKAIDNADSWAYFTLDLVGILSPSDRSKVLA